ncbi:SpoIIE family protein phosphatase [Streptomyces sp. SID5475]|nr:SpoIIE family protein phosphatase [Streptomyces xinghaiensis]MZE79285.1 SpoIIE family protein phosphatase [Streptomyces sp. SID5475]
MTVPKEPMPGGSGRMFNVAQMALAVLDGQGVVTSWTVAAEGLVGYRDDEILNRPAAALLDRPEERAAAASVAEQCRAQDGWDGVVPVRHRDGRTLTLRVRVFPLVDPAGSGRWAVLAWNERQTPGPGLDQKMLEALLAHSPIAVAVLDTDLRHVWVNDMLTYGGEWPRERRLGRRLTEMIPSEESKRTEAQYRRVLETGVALLNRESLMPNPTDPTRRRAWWENILPLQDSAGRVLGVWFMALDVTEQWRARERLALLAEASERVGSTLDVERTAQELADVAVPRFADVVAIDLLEPVLRGEEPPPGPAGSSDALRRAGQQSVHRRGPETTGEVGELLRLLPTAPKERCLGDGLAVVESLADPSASAWLAEDPARAAEIRASGIHSFLVAPVRARGVCLGVATFARSECPDAFDRGDASLAEELLAQAGVSLDNARRFTREHRAALVLQHSLLPHSLAGGTVLEVASRYLPAHAPHAVGGDWFDVIPLSGARVALVVGDVVGHGMHAAVTMGRLRTAVRTLADLDLPPDELLAHLDDLVISLVEQEEGHEATADRPPDIAASALGTTCLYAAYDPVTRRCTLARAGHPPPALVGTDGTVTFPDLPAGPPLGLGFLPFEAAELELPDGALLALYTDGLLGVHADVDVGLTRLTEALSRPAAHLEAVCENVVGSLPTGPPSDDAALLLARTHGLDADQVATWPLTSDPAIVAEARDLASRQLTDWDLEELQLTTELIVSELVTNAIRHGSEPVHLRLIRQNVLICEVSDGSSTSPRLRHARTTDEGGRGLFLIAQFARRWGTRYTTTGKIIWAEQGIPVLATSPVPQRA